MATDIPRTEFDQVYRTLRTPNFKAIVAIIAKTTRDDGGEPTFADCWQAYLDSKAKPKRKRRQRNAGERPGEKEREDQLKEADLRADGEQATNS